MENRKENFYLDISSHCYVKVENLCKAADKASMAAAGMCTRPEEICMAMWAALVRKEVNILNSNLLPRRSEWLSRVCPLQWRNA